MPILLASIAAAVLTSIISFSQAGRWALQDVKQRSECMEKALRHTTFPLSTSVLATIAELTSTEIVVIDQKLQMVTSTLVLQAADKRSAMETFASALKSPGKSGQLSLSLGSKNYLVFTFQRRGDGVSNDLGNQVIALFDKNLIAATAQRAAIFPLATGLITIAFLTTLTMVASSRLVQRLIQLKRSVERVADGDFETRVHEPALDEVGQLGKAVNQMAEQLGQLWQEVNRQQSEKLLHQIAAGFAHQLRNTLTGSRMAMELHRNRIEKSDHEEIDVAIRQLEIAEQYVRRLLLIGAGRQDQLQAGSLHRCLHDVYATHLAIANHHRVGLKLTADESLLPYNILDVASFCAAISNLVLNALQVAKEVTIHANIESNDKCRVTVADNGPGVDSVIANRIFEPFVSTKSEGVGLGLPLVLRAATQLGGDITWSRVGDRTVFEFTCLVQRNLSNG